MLNKNLFQNALLVVTALVGLGACTGVQQPPQAADGKQPKMLWFDASANFRRFASQDSIRYYLDKTVETGFNRVAIDVRPCAGQALYHSEILDPMIASDGDTIVRDWDYLQCFIDEAHKRNLKVTISTTIFPAGSTHRRLGPAYDDPSFEGRTCVEYTPEGMKDIKDDPSRVAAFMNPALPENRAYALSFVREMLTKYQVEGLCLDYCRYPDAASDFSEASHKAFEEYLGHPVKNFPQEIFTYAADGSRVPGKYYKEWWAFRAKVIRDFVADVRASINELQPEVSLEYWAASWLHAIYGNGQNWASPRSKFCEEFYDDWASPAYAQAGFADQLDVFITGTYLERVWGADDNESIEYGLARSVRDVEGDCAVWGSIYGQNHNEEFEDAVYLCMNRTAGMAVFDIVQVIERDLWGAIKRGIDRAESETNE